MSEEMVLVPVELLRAVRCALKNDLPSDHLWKQLGKYAHPAPSIPLPHLTNREKTQ